MEKPRRDAIFWIPRILSILFILFLALFSLDVFDGNYGFWGTALALFMHNLPSLVLLIVLLIAWKCDLVGAIVYFLAGLAYIASIVFGKMHDGFHGYMLSWILFITGPAWAIAALFLLGWRRKKKIC